MKVTKLGHCCLLIEAQGVRLLTDPGAWTSAQHAVTGLDAVLITHEHSDHFHLESLREVSANNPAARIITNSAVGKLLKAAGIIHEIVEDGGLGTIKKVPIEGVGQLHAPVYSDIVPVMNTGYLVANQLFYPGDAFTLPGRPVDVLALPVVGPWMKIAEALDYAKAVKPAHVFPVHDGMLKTTNWLYGHPARVLPAVGITFVPMEVGKEYTFEL